MRPIVIINVRRTIDIKATPEQILDAKKFLDNYLHFNARVPGRIEQTVHIFDLKDVGV